MPEALRVILKGWPYGVVIGVMGVMLYLAYTYGIDTANKRWQVQKDEANHALTQAHTRVRVLEQQATHTQAEIESKYVQRSKHAKARVHHLITDLHAGRIRMRDEIKGTKRVSSTTSSPGECDAACGGGLPTEHVEALVQLAGRAQATAEQLRAAQQVIVADREICNGK